MFYRMHKDERGLTALETAIILIAFIVVASVFAFTILSAGTFSTERGKEAVYAGLEEVQASMEVKGSVVAINNTEGISGTGSLSDLVFTVGNVVGGEPIDLRTTNPVVVINYRDQTQQIDLTDAFSVTWKVRNDGDDLLESGELAELTVSLATLTNALSTNTEFSLEIKPPKGSVVSLQRTTPAYIDAVVDLQ